MDERASKPLGTATQETPTEKTQPQKNIQKKNEAVSTENPKDPGHLPKHTHHSENTKRGGNTQQNTNSGKPPLMNHHLHQA